MGKRIRGVYLVKNDEGKKIYCLAQQINDREIEVRYLDKNDNPSDIVEKISTADFDQKFVPPKYYFEGKIFKVNQILNEAEKLVSENQLEVAENKFQNALELDGENLRANFGVGNLYLKTGETEKAKEIFTKISKLDSIFEGENKHFFNECGIQLRKQQLYNEAIDFYKKALSLSSDDENLYFNLARAYFENGDTGKANESIDKSLELNNDFKEAKAYIEYMKKRGGIYIKS